MKTRKWLWWTMGIIGSLALFAGVGLAGYRIGLMQGTESEGNPRTFMFNRFEDMRGHPGFDRLDDGMPQFHHGNRFELGRGGFPPLFGLFRLAFWAFILWLVYSFFTRSGWKLVRESPPAVEVVEQKKPRAKKSS